MLPTRLSNFIDRITRRYRRGTSLADETLLDFHIRAYLRSEYANEIPPSGAFPRLMHAVQLHREEKQKHVEAGIREKLARNFRQLGRAFGVLYHILGRGDTARIVSSGMVTALMLFAMWPSMKQMLASNYLAPSPHIGTSVDDGNSSYPRDLVTPKDPNAMAILPPGTTQPSVTSPNSVDERRNQLINKRIGDAPTVSPAVSASEDPNYLHPFERGLGKRASPPTIYERPIIGQE